MVASVGRCKTRGVGLAMTEVCFSFHVPTKPVNVWLLIYLTRLFSKNIQLQTSTSYA